MATNNDRFLVAYNRLDHFLQTLVVVKGHVNMISYLERISPEKKRAEIKTIREYKNLMSSHGVFPGYERPEVPTVWITWLHNELAWCKRNSTIIAPKLQKLLDEDEEKKKKGTRKAKSDDGKKPTKKSEESGGSDESYTDYYARMYGYTRATPETLAGKHLYEFVDTPPAVPPFGKMPDGYGWVICNQRGQFLGAAHSEDWEKSFADAIVFETKKEADKRVAEIKKGYKNSSYPAPYMVVRCVKLK